MKEFIQLMAALLGSLGFAALFNIRGKKLIFATIGGFLSWQLPVSMQTPISADLFPRY